MWHTGKTRRTKHKKKTHTQRRKVHLQRRRWRMLHHTASVALCRTQTNVWMIFESVRASIAAGHNELGLVRPNARQRRRSQCILPGTLWEYNLHRDKTPPMNACLFTHVSRVLVHCTQSIYCGNVVGNGDGVTHALFVCWLLLTIDVLFLFSLALYAVRILFNYINIIFWQVRKKSGILPKVHRRIYCACSCSKVKKIYRI